MEMFATDSLRRAAALIADHAEQIADEMNAADARVGDGDLGITLSGGWREVAAAAPDFPEDVGLTFLECAKCFQRASSSSFGTLVATGFMSAAKQCKGRTAIPFGEVSGLLRGACEAMMARGKGRLGDKTMLDVIDAIAGAAAQQQSAAGVLDAAGRAVGETLAVFRDRPNKIGRARMFGEKSIGVADPGMLAVKEMVRALRGAL